MSSKKMCCVMGCPSTQTKPALYLYPAKPSPRYKRWLALFPNSFVLHSDKDNYICRRHFTPESFDEKLSLKHSADPTINIDTSYAQDQILKTFLIKVIYEWSLRSNVSKGASIAKKALEAKDLLGISSLKVDGFWISNFLQIRQSNLKSGIRFGKNTTEGCEIFDIIKDLRHYLPSNFALPFDLMDISSTGDQIAVKNECISDDEAENTTRKDQNEKSSQKDVSEATVTIEDTSHTTLDTYQDALEMLKPLAAYITRIGNINALARLREVETVVKQVVQSEQRPRRGVKRNR